MERDTEMQDVSDRKRDGSRDRDRRRDDRSRSRERDRDSRRSPERRRSSRDHRRSRRSPSGSRSRSPPRSRHHHHDRSRSRSRDRSYRRGDSYDRERDRGDRDRRYDAYRPSRRQRTPPPSSGGPINAPIEEAEAHAKSSVRENRVYVGNLAYQTNYKDLQAYMEQAGPVVFSEIFVTPGGVSKGCGIVEFGDRESVVAAIKDLAGKPLLGRPCFIREDREEAARFGATPIPGKIGAAMGEVAVGGFAPRGGFRGGFAGGFNAPPQSAPVDYKQLFIGGLPPQAGWQDLKDLFRGAGTGSVIRADISVFPDGRPKGSGIVVYENHEDAKAAVEQFNNYAWFESILQVRPDRFATPGGGFRGGRGGFVPRGAFNGGFAPRGGFIPRGGFGGGFNNGMNMMGNHMGGMMGGGMRGGVAAGGGRNFTTDLYADYSGPEAAAAGGMNGGVMDGPGLAVGMPMVAAEPSAQIYVRNLPWSTSNEDLVELFETTGQVVLAEILYTGGQSKGAGVVQFKEVEEADSACQKFTGYVYGGRPLDVRFNAIWHNFSETAAAGGTVPAA